jgi:hypothetical protein
MNLEGGNGHRKELPFFYNFISYNHLHREAGGM